MNQALDSGQTEDGNQLQPKRGRVNISEMITKCKKVKLGVAHAVLDCGIVLHSALYSSMLYCTVQYCTVQHCNCFAVKNLANLVEEQSKGRKREGRGWVTLRLEEPARVALNPL